MKDIPKEDIEKQKDLHEAFKALQEGYLAEKERDNFILTKVIVPLVVACIATTGAVVIFAVKFLQN